MKLKKKTNIMLAASATVAAVGIAAVSFAAWTGNTTNSFNASAATGSVAFYGFTSTPVEDYSNVKLFPHDQTGLTAESDVTVLEIVIPEIEYSQNCKLQFTATTGVSLKYSYGDTAVTDKHANVDESTYTAITSGETVQLGDALTYDNSGVNTKEESYLHIILISGSTDDMNQDFSINVEIVAAQ